MAIKSVGVESSGVSVVSFPATEVKSGNTVRLRIGINAGETINILALGIQRSDNVTPVGIDINVYDENNSNQIATANAKRTTGDPIHSEDGAIDIALEMHNNTGTDAILSAYMEYEIV